MWLEVALVLIFARLFLFFDENALTLEVHLALWEGFGALTSEVDEFGFLLFKQLSLLLENTIDHEDKGSNSEWHNDQNQEDRAQEDSLCMRHVHVEKWLLIVTLMHCTVIDALMDSESWIVGISFGLELLPHFIAMCRIDIVLCNFKCVPFALLSVILLLLKSIVTVCILADSWVDNSCSWLFRSWSNCFRSGWRCWSNCYLILNSTGSFQQIIVFTDLLVYVLLVIVVMDLLEVLGVVAVSVAVDSRSVQELSFLLGLVDQTEGRD